jgi:hypothetical protein
MVLFGSHSNQNITFADDHPRNIPVVYSRKVSRYQRDNQNP